ncbi:Chloride channel protein CLC-b, putative [Perkinsus marinus ATCC 50983]|uniref:Chloride channel protein n=1 Tax=Perkinsus marinus (strain ATCC 50983 / TXsc) TaxID=423536 RepID=C5KCM7_PERM5|nr:Chloride channel protein CLC-b, putative [Perkinsus marinus ATCC 50983]EER17626.1 Chloride channel protein CLC-b, putative [Perkinsus marinus ATCC 50983]|eukprot:XP_002785830.1 Chloride channel protein CLC-b, putative [Perkinsus marinus ATCC 50983]
MSSPSSTKPKAEMSISKLETSSCSCSETYSSARGSKGSSEEEETEALLKVSQFQEGVKGIESHDYFWDHPTIHDGSIPVGPSGPLDPRKPSCYSPFIAQWVKWILTIVEGAVIGICRGVILIGSHWLLVGKTDAMIHWLKSDNPGCAMLIWIAIGVPLICFIGWGVSYMSPLAGGSGIPDVKAYLNGVMVPKLMRFWGIVWRILGQIVVVGTGHYAGSEGPMAHLGAIVGAAVAQMHARNKFYLKALLPFSTQKVKDEFVSMGAGMGVATAFEAPIGGMLFTIEEASTYWPRELYWRCFLGCIIASYMTRLTAQYFQCKVEGSCVNLAGGMQFPNADESYFHVWEFACFILLGIFFGLMGAIFCQGVRYFQYYRRVFFHLYSNGKDRRRFGQVVEAGLVMLITILLAYGVSWSEMGACKPLDGQSYIPNDGIQAAMCDEGVDMGYYNPLAAMLLTDRDTSVKWLFSPRLGEAEFPQGQLAAAGFIIFFLTLLTYGVAIPAGLFVPNIMLGACFGRLFGLWVGEWASNPGVYAVMGAAGMMAGFTRMTISLTVIVIELVGDLRLLPAVMVTVVVSKQVADMFNKGAYDIVSELRGYPYIEELSIYDERNMAGKYVTYRMSAAPLSGFGEVETLGRIQEVLSTCTHNAFTIEDSSHRLLGIVMRANIVDLVKAHGGAVSASSRLNLLNMTNRTPTIVSELTPLAQAYTIFRNLALRHMIVVDKDDANHVVGIVTRKDIVDSMEDAADEFGKPGKSDDTVSHSSTAAASRTSIIDDVL